MTLWERFGAWLRRLTDPHERIDGCEFTDADETIPDEDIAGIVLFADLAGTDDLAAIERRRQEWLTLFGGSTDAA